MRSSLSYGLLLSSYFLACLLRSGSGVIFPAVAADIGISPAAIGLISGMFYYGYTLAQPYCGMLCDRKSPVFAVSLGMIIFSLGLFMFSFTKDPYILGISRFLAGVGAGPTFCALMAYQANAFPPAIFPRLTALTIVLGHLGNVVAISPLGGVIDLFGYRRTHFSLALFSLSILLLLLLLLKGSDLRKRGFCENEKGSLLSGFRVIFGSKRLTSLLMIWSTSLILQLTLIGLWGVIWLTSERADISVYHARLCMTLGGFGVLAGAFLAGIIGNRLILVPKFMQVLLVSMILVLTLLTFSINSGLTWQLISFISFLLGISIGTSLVISNVVLFRAVGPELIGTVTGANNVVLFLSVLLSQWFSGAFIDYLQQFSLPAGISPYSVFFSLLIITGAGIAVSLRKVNFTDDPSRV